MAGMFYSLKETMEKLSKTEDQVNELVRQGRLREFRDGSNLLFKINEVQALLSDTSMMIAKDSADEEDEITLAPEPVETTEAGGLTGADTAIAGEGINVLADSDSDFLMSDDTAAETKAASGEVSLEQIEEDVNLDTFGSGSGLLDLSLQADDTSLGGILDEIYTPEGEEGQAPPEDLQPEAAPDAEQMLSAVGIDTPESEPQITSAAQAYVEPQPDALSNAFGIMLVLPLLAVVYTIIVAVAGFGGPAPAVVTDLQGVIWYILVGAVVAAALIIGVAFMLRAKPVKTPKVKKTAKTEQAVPPTTQSPEELA